MLKSCLSLLLCLLLLPKVSFAAEKGPVVREVSPEVFEHLVKSGKAHQIHLSQTDEEKIKKKKEEERLEKASNDANNFADIFTDFGTGGTKDAALVIFAIVGVVVVVAWIPYVPVLFYDYATGDKEKFQISQMATLQGTTIIGEGDEQTARHGGLLGARYSVFVEEIEKASSIKKGLSFESGYYSTKEDTVSVDSSEVRREGAYWLVGPTLMVGDKIDFNNSIFAKLDLMGGTSFDRDLGLVMKADFSANWLFRSGFTFGAGIGGLYLHVKDDEGVLADANDIALTFSGIMGYAF